MAKKKIYRILYWAMVVLAGSVFLVAAFMIGKHFYEAKKSADQFEQLEALVETPPVEQEEQIKELTPREKYASLLAENDDFAGWIQIADTRINYPVMQTVDEPNFYLRRGFDKEYDYYGIPYAAEHCDLQESDNVVIYGHHMNNGTMFSDLKKYSSKDFYLTHSRIRFDTLEEFGTYEIFAVFKISAYDSFDYHHFSDAIDEADFDRFVAECKKHSYYDTGITPQYGDRLLTLSTCEYSIDNGRLVVLARKI